MFNKIKELKKEKMQVWQTVFLAVLISVISFGFGMHAGKKTTTQTIASKASDQDPINEDVVVWNPYAQRYHNHATNTLAS